jgi:ribosome modulation factor
MTEIRKKEIEAQGYHEFMAMFDESACPFKDEVERTLWLKGFADAKALWNRPFVKAKTSSSRFDGKLKTQHSRYTRNGGRK